MLFVGFVLREQTNAGIAIFDPLFKLFAAEKKPESIDMTPNETSAVRCLAMSAWLSIVCRVSDPYNTGRARYFVTVSRIAKPTTP